MISSFVWLLYPQSVLGGMTTFFDKICIRKVDKILSTFCGRRQNSILLSSPQRLDSFIDFFFTDENRVFVNDSS